MSQATDWSVPLSGPATPNAMAQRMDESFGALLSSHSGASRPAYAVAGTVWLSTATAGQHKYYHYDGAADRLLYTVDTATGAVIFADDGGTKWRIRGIGEIYMVNTALAGVDIPPSSATDTVWIELTAGLTGAGAFNNGKLTSESVSGSAPLVLATAVISVSGSPMNGQTVRLINTEGRILRPSTSPGTLQDDAFQGHRHLGTAPTNVSGTSAPTISAGSNFDRTIISEGDGTIAGSNGTPRTATETRMKNVGVKAFMRVK